MSINITVTNVAGKRQFGAYSLPATAKVAQLKDAFAKQNKKYYPERQYFYLKNADGSRGEAVKEDVTLAAQGVKTGDVLLFKDLGTQIGWRTVYMIEYLGPLVSFYLMYLLRPYLYPLLGVEGADKPVSCAQWIALGLWTLHFVKRELETIFIHTFSKSTMPFLFLFRNSGYYWFFGFFVAYFVMHPNFTAPSELQTYIGAAIFLLAVLGNLHAHLSLAWLRPKGSSERFIPHGFMFELISFPNYFFEVITWVGFTIATQSLPALLFTLVGGLQMLDWAIGKHRRYRREFDGKEGRKAYPRNRKAMIPFLI